MSIWVHIHHHAEPVIVGVLSGIVGTSTFFLLSDAVSLAIIGGIAACVAGVPPSILAYANLQAAKTAALNAQLAQAQAQLQVEKVEKKTDVVIEKATEIHTLTNSNLTKVTESLNVANMKIEGLQKLILQMADAKGLTDRQNETLVNAAGEHTGSGAANNAKLDHLKTMLTEVQSGSPPIPVKDEAVLAKLNDVVVGKLDDIKEQVDNPPKPKD